MNKIERRRLVWKNLNEFFDISSRLDTNVVKLNTNNSLEHELKKAEIAFNCIKDGFTIITEGKLKSGKRPDVTILDLNIPIVYEVAKSETEDSLIQKEKDYKGMKVIKVRI